MKVRLCVSGKLKLSPELTLFERYRSRLERVGRAINLSPITVSEFESLKWIKFINDLNTSKLVSSRSHKILLDENGKIFSSVSFANALRLHRDKGTPEIIFFIGGATGVSPKLKQNFDEVLSIGKMVWPHLLVRVLLMEQLYRASTILAGLPYHKD